MAASEGQDKVDDPKKQGTRWDFCCSHDKWTVPVFDSYILIFSAEYIFVFGQCQALLFLDHILQPHRESRSLIINSRVAHINR